MDIIKRVNKLSDLFFLFFEILNYKNEMVVLDEFKFLFRFGILKILSYCDVFFIFVGVGRNLFLVGIWNVCYYRNCVVKMGVVGLEFFMM